MENIKFFGEGAEFAHVGIVVSSIDRITAARKIQDTLQHVSVAFVDLYGCPIELIESLDDSSPITEMLNKGITVYHLCFKVPDLDNALQVAGKNGFCCFKEPKEAAAFGKRKIAWVFNRDYGIFELLEK